MAEPGVKPLILLTGATGYVGGVLLKELEARGHAVRCLARRPGKLADLASRYAIWPLHELVFRRMLAGIARSAVRGR